MEITTSEAAPRPHSSFDEMGLSPEVLQAVTQDMKYNAPTPVQSAAFGPIREGKDVVVQSRTGTGKTAAFGMPLADRIDPDLKAPQLLVLAPTRELANQVNTELERLNRHRGNRCLAIYGGSAFGPQLEALKAGSQIIAGTPGRVLDHLRRGTLKLNDLRFFILDEADEMLSMGFQDELEAILEFVPKKRQSMLFSATFPPEIRQMIDRYLTDPHEIMLSSGNISVDEITHYYYVTSHMRKPQTLLTLLEYEEPDAAIIFTNTRDDANFIGQFLQNRGHDAEVLTGELTQSAREKVMAKIKGGRLRYLVATDVAARGIDITDLSHVINYNLPESPEVYVHRTGRTGRAGKSGTAVSVVSGLDISTLYALTRWMKIAVEERPIPTDAEVQAHKLDNQVTKLVGEVRGRIEEGELSDTENQHLLLADRVLAEPRAREIVATLLERTLKAPAPKGEAAPAKKPETEATPVEEAVPISDEQREFEEQQMMRSRRGPKGPGGRGGSGRGGERGRGPAGRGERSAGPGRGERSAGPGRGERSAGPGRGERAAGAGRGERGGANRGERESRSRSAGSAPDDSKTLMVTLGRRHKMGSREVGLFVVESAGVEIGQIRDVRVRDGYSFVDVEPAIADKVISAVSAKEHEGRPVKAELARKQRGEESAPARAPQESPATSEAASGDNRGE